MAPVKYEDDYIVEFIEFYLLNEVDHFYFYYNENEIPLKDTLKKSEKYCTINKISGEFTQINSYKRWIDNYKSKTKWIAVWA